MKLIADLHTHTIASGHAFSSLKEMVDQAKVLGYKALAITDHGPAMPGAPYIWYFQAIKNLPQQLEDGFRLLRGAEVNIMDVDGRLDIEDDVLSQLDWVVASLHPKCLDALSHEDATRLWLRIAENPLVDMIGHSEEEKYRYDYGRVCKAFAQHGKVVELNANSPIARPGNGENIATIIQECKKNEAYIVINSDAHSVYEMDNKAWAIELVQKLGYPESLIVNTSMDIIDAVFAKHRQEKEKYITK